MSSSESKVTSFMLPKPTKPPGRPPLETRPYHMLAGVGEYWKPAFQVVWFHSASFLPSKPSTAALRKIHRSTAKPKLMPIRTSFWMCVLMSWSWRMPPNSVHLSPTWYSTFP